MDDFVSPGRVLFLHQLASHVFHLLLVVLHFGLQNLCFTHSELMENPMQPLISEFLFTLLRLSYCHIALLRFSFILHFTCAFHSGINLRCLSFS